MFIIDNNSDKFDFDLYKFCGFRSFVDAIKSLFMKYFYIIFALICIVDLAFIDLYPIGRLVAKPLIVSSLLCYYIISLEKQHSFIILGMVFAIIGDVFLLFSGDTVFKLGLLSFLLMQLCYINYLRKFRLKQSNTIHKVLILILFIVTLVFNTMIYINGVEIWMLIAIYSIVLLIMASLAILFPTKGGISGIGIGAVIFVLSDLILAIDKFLFPVVLSEYLVMITYCIAQYLIISGITKDAVAYFESKKRSVN